MKTSAGVALALSLAATGSAAPGPEEKPVAAKPSQAVLLGERDFNTCRKFRPGKRIVKLNLKPDTELGDLIAWISSITCKQFLLPGTIPANSKTVTVAGPELITPEEAYRLFLGALDSAGLTVEHTGKFERIVETAKIKTMGGIPVYPEGSDVARRETYVTRLVRRESLSPRDRAELLRLTSHIDSVSPPEVFVINEMARIIGEKDAHACKQPPPGAAGVKLNLKPDTKVADLIAWIASVTCKQFLLPDTTPADGKKVTVVAPELITSEEAYKLFLAALDSVGLTVEGSGNVMSVVETATPESFITRLFHVEYVDPHEVAQVLGRIKSERGKIVVIEATGALIVTDMPENMHRMMRALPRE